MTAISVSAPFPILTDIDGDPLDAGYVYIGQANLDPVAFPKSAYWDASLTTPAAQPIRTTGGYPVRNGSPARIYTDGDYSIRINNKNGTLVYSSPAATERMDSALVGYDGGTVQDVLDGAVSKADYVELRAYTGRATAVRITSASLSGQFQYDPADISSIDDGIIVIVGADGRRWKRQYGDVLYVEWAGASTLSSPAQNAIAITSAFNALTDGISLRQKSSLLVTDQISVTKTLKNCDIRLNLKYSGVSGAVNGVVYLDGFALSNLNISVDVDNKNSNGIYLRNCTGSKIPRSAKIQKIYATTSICAAVFARDSDDMEMYPTIENVTSDGSQVVRGIMISDQTVAKNTSIVKPAIKNITVPVGSSVSDADGVYCENSNAEHAGGIKIINGNYENCSKRFIKCNMENPVICGNTGTTSGDVEMYSFVSVYADNAGYIGENNFEKSGSTGSYCGIELGVPSNVLTFRLGKNLMKSGVVAGSSQAIRVEGKCVDGIAELGVAVGFQAAFAQSSTASDKTGQSLILKDGSFDKLTDTVVRNAVQVRGNYERFTVSGIHAKVPVASAFFVSASEVSANIAEIIDNTHAYSFGRLSGNRPLNSWDAQSLANNSIPRFVNGRAIARRNGVPTGSAWEIGDMVEMTTPVAGGQIGWVCTAAGTPGTWKAYGTIAA